MRTPYSPFPISHSHFHSDRLLPLAAAPSNTPSLPPFRWRNDSLRSRIVPAGGCSSARLRSVLTRLPCLFLPPFVGATNLHFPGQLNAHADERAHKAVTCESRVASRLALGVGQRESKKVRLCTFAFCVAYLMLLFTLLFALLCCRWLGIARLLVYSRISSPVFVVLVFAFAVVWIRPAIYCPSSNPRCSLARRVFGSILSFLFPCSRRLRLVCRTCSAVELDMSLP